MFTKYQKNHFSTKKRPRRKTAVFDNIRLSLHGKNGNMYAYMIPEKIYRRECINVQRLCKMRQKLTHITTEAAQKSTEVSKIFSFSGASPLPSRMSSYDTEIFSNSGEVYIFFMLFTFTFRYYAPRLALYFERSISALAF